MKHFLRAVIVTAGLFTAPFGATAHDAAKGPHGGPMVTVGDRHLEMTVGASGLTVYVSDARHQSIATAGTTGRAVIQSGGKTATVALQPGDVNRLEGKTEGPLANGARVVVSLTLAGGETVQARFVAP